jgi:hypothetical protein
MIVLKMTPAMQEKASKCFESEEQARRVEAEFHAEWEKKTPAEQEQIIQEALGSYKSDLKTN